jgi:hypothetical protein
MFAIILFVLLLFTPPAYAITVDAIDLSNRAYFDAALNEINNAKKEIDVAMYLIYIDYGDIDNPAYKLVDALINAKSRGVAVKVYLNNDNNEAYQLLKSAGIDAFLIKPALKVHAKLIVIDGTTVIDGSANWTSNALLENFESNNLIRSIEFAQTKLALFETLKNNIAPEPVVKPVPSVTIPADFITNPKLGPQMVNDSDVRPFEFYLLLLKAQKAGEAIVIDYLKTGQDLGIPVNASRSYRQQIRLFADKLKTKYNLIDYTLSKKNALTITLTPAGQSPAFSLPLAFWDYGINKALRLREQFAYLAALNEQSIAQPKPFWQMGQEDLAKKYSIDNVLFSYSFQALKKLDLIQIFPARADDGNYIGRGANCYRVKPVVSPEDKAKAWGALEKAHGAEMVKTAVTLAAMLDEENNIDSVKTIIRFIEEYKLPAVEEAVKRLAKYSDGNPLKNLRYLEGVIRNVVNGT